MKDKLLGEIERHIDAWVGEIPFQYSCSGTEVVSFRIRSGESGPNYEQIIMVEELAKHYEVVWPKIQVKLKELRPEIDISVLNELLKPRLLLYIPGLINSEVFDFLLSYEFKDEESGGVGYFIGFVGWEIKSAVKAC